MSALSSYQDDDGGPSLEVISGSVPTYQTAACWTVVARLGRYVYVTNTGSGTWTGYRVSLSGELKRPGLRGKPNRCCNQPAWRQALCLVYIHRQDRLV